MTTRRNTLISVFVIAWILGFHYEALRIKALTPLLGREPPKIRFLFPPEGWVMFCCVETYAIAPKIYGMRSAFLGPDSRPMFVPPQSPWELIDPHRIFADPWINSDYIRFMLLTPLDSSYQPDFCRYLHRKFPEYHDFAVMGKVKPWKNPKASIPISYRC